CTARLVGGGDAPAALGAAPGGPGRQQRDRARSRDRRSLLPPVLPAARRAAKEAVVPSPEGVRVGRCPSAQGGGAPDFAGSTWGGARSSPPRPPPPWAEGARVQRGCSGGGDLSARTYGLVEGGGVGVSAGLSPPLSPALSPALSPPLSPALASLPFLSS